MSTSAYQDLLVELARDLEQSETEEFELRRLERYLIRKLADDGTVGPGGDALASPREDERRLDLLDAVRRDLVDVERVLDELRVLDTRVRRLSARHVSNGRPEAPDAAPADPPAAAAGPPRPVNEPGSPAAAAVPAAGFAIEDLLEPLGRPQRYERAYLCYAPKDRHEVQHRAGLLADAGIAAVEDNLALDASQRWARGVYRQIDACDVLFLFWSPAAAESAWVQKEWQYGLKRRGADFIRLIPLAGAPPAPLAFLQPHGPAEIPAGRS